MSSKKKKHIVNIVHICELTRIERVSRISDKLSLKKCCLISTAPSFKLLYREDKILFAQQAS